MKEQTLDPQSPARQTHVCPASRTMAFTVALTLEMEYHEELYRLTLTSPRNVVLQQLTIYSSEYITRYIYPPPLQMETP